MKLVFAGPALLLTCALLGCSQPNASALVTSARPSDPPPSSQQVPPTDPKSDPSKAVNTFGESTDPAADDAAKARDREANEASPQGGASSH